MFQTILVFNTEPEHNIILSGEYLYLFLWIVNNFNYSEIGKTWWNFYQFLKSLS